MITDIVGICACPGAYMRMSLNYIETDRENGCLVANDIFIYICLESVEIRFKFH